MLFCKSSNAKLPEKVFSALFNGNCATVEGKPAMTPEDTCRSLVGKLFSSCPSDTNPDRVTITFTTAQPVSEMFNCGVSVTLNPPGAASSTHQSTIGQASYKYLCLDQHLMPISIFDWGSYASLDPNVECPVPCPVKPLKPITDPDALKFERGETLRLNKLSAKMQENALCLVSKAKLAGIPLHIKSAWRPQAYQDHFYEIYTKLLMLDDPINKKNPECAPRIKEIEGEANEHGIAQIDKRTQKRTLVASKSDHRDGNAIDAPWRDKNTINFLISVLPQTGAV